MNQPRVPTKATLKKYGLTEAEWKAILERGGGGCAICGNVPASGTLHVDHEHVKGWKKMAPEQRKKYVRGILDWHCNAFIMRRGVTPAKLRAAADYLEAHERRKNGQES